MTPSPPPTTPLEIASTPKETTLATGDHAAANHHMRWWILAVLGIAQLMVILDNTIVNIALPTAQHALHFSNADRQWIVTAYSLAFGSLLLLGGRIGDLIGLEQATASVDRIRELRAEKGLSMDDFTVITPLVDAFTMDHYRRADDAGISAVLTMPWVFYAGVTPSLSEKIDGMRRFREAYFPDA